MKNEYDFSKSAPTNAYLDKLEEQIVNYFKQLAAKSGISYQNVISLSLKDCMQTQRKLSLRWAEAQ